MKKTRDKPTVPVKITFTDGYEERFTQAVLKIFAKRLRKENEKVAEYVSEDASFYPCRKIG